MTEAPGLSTSFCLAGSGLLVLVILLAAAIRIIPQDQRLAVYRLGRYMGERGPGLILLIPFLDRGVVVNTQDEAARVQDSPTQSGVSGEGKE